MDRAVSDPSREMESLFQTPSQALSVSLANVHSEMESGHRQVQEEVPAIAVDKAPPVVTQFPEAACPPILPIF